MGQNFRQIVELLDLHGASVEVRPHFSPSGTLQRLMIPPQLGFSRNVRVDLRRSESETAGAILELVRERLGRTGLHELNGFDS